MNPYLIEEPTSVSFSGGRTSAYMLHKVLEANNGLPEGSVVTFANTGREMPETLDFVRDCSLHWDVPIVWLELGEYVQSGVYKSGSKEGLPRWKAETRVVTYETASRDGEPFKRLCAKRKYLPNIMSRFCTADLKVRRIRDYLNGLAKQEWVQMIGIRGDEPRRAAKIHNKLDEGHFMFAPLFVDKVTKQDVHAFWKAQKFDLGLYSNDGTTDWGNCDLCFLKSGKKKISMIRQRPDLAEWWIGMEEMMTTSAGTAGTFRNDQPTYQEMLVIATDQPSMFDDDNSDSISCFCGE